jgi:secretion/DNA translocation related TadE-like protein
MVVRVAAGPRGERGSGTLLAVGTALGVLSAGVVGVLWAAVSIGHHRVEAAADLAALSVAQSLQSGDRDACGTAERIAQRHTVHLIGCRVEGEVVSVIVGAELRLGALGTPEVKAEARAGPAGDG